MSLRKSSSPTPLRPLAEPEAQPDAFYQGLRLAAVDGTSHNLRSTPAMKARAVKSRCQGRSGESAFARLGSVVLVELAPTSPLPPPSDGKTRASSRWSTRSAHKEPSCPARSC